MKVIIQSIHFTATDRLKNYIQKKCNKLDLFYDNIVEGIVFLKLDATKTKQNKAVEIKLSVPGGTLVAKEASSSFEASMDLCMRKLKVQLQRHKSRLKAAS